MQNILIIGCGNMGLSILKGWVADASYLITVVDPNEHNRTQAKALGASVYQSLEDLKALDPKCVDLLLIAVKPQLLHAVLPPYAALMNSQTVVISIAAGISLKQLHAALPQQNIVVRCMPNIAASVCEGVMACAVNEQLPMEINSGISELLKLNGSVVWLNDESQIDAVTAISGSGPAYYYLMTEYLSNAGVALGLPCELSNMLARATFTGSAALLKESDLVSPKQLRQSVTSVGGTTEAGLAKLMCPSDGLKPLLERTTKSAKERSVELSQAITA